MYGKHEQFIEMLSSPPLPDKFIDSNQATSAGLLPSDTLCSNEDLIAGTNHPGINLQLQSPRNNFQAILFNVVKIGEHMDYGLEFKCKVGSAASATGNILKHGRANIPKNTALALLDGKSQLDSRHVEVGRVINDSPANKRVTNIVRTHGGNSDDGQLRRHVGSLR
jgi:hypothetical protein